jgi:TolB protein
VIGRLAGVVLVACALFELPVVAQAEVPPGPQLTFIRAGDGRSELVGADPAGQDQRVIAGGGEDVRPLPLPVSSPAWSADGARVVFAGLARYGSGAQANLFAAAADDTGLVKLPSTSEAFYPVLSPDGHTVAFARMRERQARRSRRDEATVFRSISTWLLDLDSGTAKRITPWRNELYEYPSSFSPDGSTLAISRDQPTKHGRFQLSAVAMRLDGSGSTVIARHASEPTYSPDGSRIALIATGKTTTIKSDRGSTTITPTDLAVANADGSGLTKLTHTRALEFRPQWDPSGQRLAYTQFRAGAGEAVLLGIGDSIMEVNADGSCRTRVLSYPGVTLYGATWQPGPGREAGRIAC